METNNQQLNLEKYNENYVYKLIDMCFQFFDSHIDKEKYEEDIDNFIREFSEVKPNDTKFNIKSIVEFIEKYANAEENYLEENMRMISIN